jgi:hypothetical protein
MGSPSVKRFLYDGIMAPAEPRHVRISGRPLLLESYGTLCGTLHHMYVEIWQCHVG